MEWEEENLFMSAYGIIMNAYLLVFVMKTYYGVMFKSVGLCFSHHLCEALGPLCRRLPLKEGTSLVL